jgi:hypothetical protein
MRRKAANPALLRIYLLNNSAGHGPGTQPLGGTAKAHTTDGMKDTRSSKQFMGGWRQQAKRLAKWDWPAIGICFATACIFWLFNALNAEHSSQVRLPLQLQLPDSQVVVLKAPPRYLQVNVTGYGWNLLRKTLGIGLEAVPVEVANWRVHALPTKTLLPAVSDALKEFKVNYLVEDSIHFELDTLVAVKLKIHVEEADLPLAYGVRVVSPLRLTPSVATLRGPASVLANYPEVLVPEFPADSIRDDFERAVALRYPRHPLVQGEEAAMLRFQVDYYLRVRAKATLQRANFPQHRPVRVVPDSAYVHYWLRQGTLMMAPGEPVLRLDFRNLNPLDSTLVPELEVPAKYLDAVSDPPVFKVLQGRQATAPLPRGSGSSPPDGR